MGLAVLKINAVATAFARGAPAHAIAMTLRGLHLKGGGLVARHASGVAM